MIQFKYKPSQATDNINFFLVLVLIYGILIKSETFKTPRESKRGLVFFFFIKAAFVSCTAGAGTELLAKANELLAKS